MEPSKSELRAALNAVVLETLPIVASGLAVLFAIFAVGHVLLLPAPIAMPMTAVASVTAVAFLALWYVLRSFALRPGWAHPLAVLMAGLVLANSLLHFYLVARPQETTNLMLLILGAGFVALSFRWLALVSAATLAGWVAVAATSLRSPSWRHFGFALLASTVLSLVVHAARVRTLRRLQRLRLLDERRGAQLRAALRASEEARQKLEVSTREMELMVRAVQQSEERFRRFTDLEGIAIHEHGRILDANPALARMFGYELPQIVGMNLLQFFTPESRAPLMEKIDTACDEPYEAMGLRTDGTSFAVDCASKTVPYQGRTARVIALRDIRERKQAEQALRRSETLYRTLADSVPGLVFTHTPEGGCDYCNRRWYEFTGLSEAQTLGFGWLTALHLEDRRRLTDHVIHSFRRGEAYEYEIRLRGRDGAYRWFFGRSSPVRDARGEIIKWVGTCMDINDRKRMEHALQEADRRKDEFLAILGHELRNPLASIRNAQHYLRTAGAGVAGNGDGRAEEARNIIDRQTAHMTRLVDDLLDLSRISSGKIALRRAPVALVELARKTVEDHRSILEGRGVTVMTRFTTARLYVIGDATRLSQVIGNVLLNAGKFTDPGGAVSVTVRRGAGSKTAVIDIRDTGIGMEPELLGRLFDPFAQGEHTGARSRGGLGLGLALTKRLVEAHGGQVSAASKGLGRGSEFTIRLPLESSDHVETAREATVSWLAPDGGQTRLSGSTPSRGLLTE